MTHRNAQLYKEIFSFLRDELSLTPTKVMSDYERAIRLAVKDVWPRSSISGCNFHFCQALRRRVATKHPEIVRLMRYKNSAKVALRMFMRLSLLPNEKDIKKGIKAIELYQKHFKIENEFLPFNNYFKKFWIKDITPSVWCVSTRKNRTNNVIEGYNNKLKKKIQRNPNVYSFLNSLQKLVLNAYAQYLNDMTKGIQKKDRSRLTKMLLKETAKLNSGASSIYRFLLVMSS